MNYVYINKLDNICQVFFISVMIFQTQCTDSEVFFVKVKALS